MGVGLGVGGIGGVQRSAIWSAGCVCVLLWECVSVSVGVCVRAYVCVCTRMCVLVCVCV